MATDTWTIRRDNPAGLYGGSVATSSPSFRHRSIVAVQRIETTYNDQGMAETVTSYAPPATSSPGSRRVQRPWQLTQSISRPMGRWIRRAIPVYSMAMDTLATGARVTPDLPNGTVLYYNYGELGELEH